ncbi:MAG TPA: esterase-like activity of phytase family protein [Methylibium sp.]|uniref:esterase-like activity of phytase family protein n=1 Tax=Methylibium sp. TaxID=2067992 RepID=UPI002DBDD33C|nr:esterase-like activity of phytase family protein [Methylibium sp.]HEU4460279.1 esterase-like activity of phytase family protein [Methylibium sp.]
MSRPSRGGPRPPGRLVDLAALLAVVVVALAFALTPFAAAARPADCPAAASLAPARAGAFELLGTARLERRPGTTTQHLGGLSGIDFDARSGSWYLLSDERGERAPPRFYPARIAFDGRRFGAIEVLAPVALPLADGERPDPEALRLLPCAGLLAWASEGDGPTLQPPSVRLVTPRGVPAGVLALPGNLRPSADPCCGARANRSLEGLALSTDGRELWLAMESPLTEDGPLPDVDHGATVRFTRLPLAGASVSKASQWAYRLDPVRQPGRAGRHRSDNGVSEILAFGDGSLLVVERAGHEVEPDRFAFEVRLYQAGIDAADDIAGQSAWNDTGGRPMSKRLLLDLATLGLPQLDNIEGAAWGPRLRDGRATLVLVSDDNFAANQVTQFLFFAVGAR